MSTDKKLKRCFYCDGKFYNHENDLHWRIQNYKGDLAHIECYNSAIDKCLVNGIHLPGKAYDDFMAGIKSIHFPPLVRYEQLPRELRELEADELYV